MEPQYRAEIVRKHRSGGDVYEVRYLDLRGLHPMDKRKLEWLAFADPDMWLAVETARAEARSR